MKEITNNIYFALKSIYRYQQILDTPFAPEVLLEQESRILKDRMVELSPEEIVTLVQAWPEFLKEYQVEEELQNQRLDEDLSSFLQNLN
jgi:hypothetical protein